MHHINKIKNKTNVIVSSGAEKAPDTILYSFLIKTLGKLGIERNFFKLIKGFYKTPTTKFILNSVRLDAFPRSGTS